MSLCQDIQQVRTGLSLPDKGLTKPPSVTATAQSVNNICSAELEVLSVNTGGRVRKGKYPPTYLVYWLTDIRMFNFPLQNALCCLKVFIQEL